MNSFVHHALAVCLAVGLSSHGAAVAQPNDKTQSSDWPQWRGSHRDNVSLDTGLLKEWPEDGPPMVWRAEGVGYGIAAVTISGGRVFVIGYHEDGEFITAMDQHSGKRLWAARIGPFVNENPLMRWLSQRSPTIDCERVYAITTGGTLVCLRATDGEEVWRKDYTVDFNAQRPGWGFCDYPLVDGDRLICTPGSRDATVVALDKHTGKLVWKCAVPDNFRIGFGATVTTEVGGVRQYVAFLGRGLAGIRASDGHVLWQYKKNANGTANSYTPIVRDDFVLSANGYGTGLALLKLEPSKDGTSVKEVYFQRRGLDAFQDSTVLVDERLYLFQGTSALACLDWRTGETIWASRRLHGSHGKAAITYADGHLYARQSNGWVTLIEPTKAEYVEKGMFEIPDHEPSIGATFPVIAGGRLYLRADNDLFCYDLRAQKRQAAPKKPQTIVLPPPKATASDNPDRKSRSVFVPTPQDVVDKMLEIADLHERERLYDLGSGDGRILITAAKKYGCYATGYEIDPRLVDMSRFRAKQAGVDSRVTVYQHDLFKAALDRANVVTLYLLPEQLECLIPQLEKLPTGSRIISHQFPIPVIENQKFVEIESKEDGTNHKIYYWTTPLKKTPK